MPTAFIACTLLHRYEDLTGTGILGATPTCTVGATPGAVPTVALVVTEIGQGWYGAAHTFTAASEFIVRWGESSPGALDGRDELVLVEPAFPPPVPGAPGIGGPVQSRLVLTLPQVKIYLRVTSAVDDGLIGTMIIASKQAADAFLGATFRERIPTITLTGVVAGDLVMVDGQTYTCVAAAPVAADREFLLGATDHDTAVNLAAVFNSDVEDEDGIPEGVQSATAVVVGTVISLQPEQGQRPVEATGDGVRFLCTRLLTDQPIPEQVAQGCLRWIAHNYEQRADGVAAVGVAGAGSVNWTAPKEALDLWQPYRVYV